MTTAQLIKPQTQEERTIDSQFQHLATLNKWLESAYETNARYNAAYNFYADWSNDSEWGNEMCRINAEGLAKNLDHIDWLNQELDYWELHIGY